MKYFYAVSIIFVAEWAFRGTERRQEREIIVVRD